MRLVDPTREEGFTVVEVLIAAIVLAVGILSVFSSVDNSQALVTTAERNEAATHVAEREMEYIKSLAYSSVALNGSPGTSSSVEDPRYYVSSGSPASYRWNHDSSPPRYEPVITGGTLSSTPTTWQDGRLSGTVHRFVTWVDDPCCAGAQNYKRITVAVTINGPARPRKPIILSSFVRKTVSLS